MSLSWCLGMLFLLNSSWIKFCANHRMNWNGYWCSLDLASRALGGGSAQEKLARFTSEIELAELAVEQGKGGVFSCKLSTPGREESQR